jgi:thioredoxin-related protein
MKKLLLPLLLLYVLPAFAQQGETTTGKKKIDWLSFNEMMTKMESQSKKILVFITTDWAGWGKRMDQSTFSDSLIIEMVQRYFFPVKLDAEYKEDIVVRDRTYKFIPNGRRGYHELAAELLNGRMAYPYCVFLDESGNIITTLPGYKEPDELNVVLEYIRTDSYKTMTWDAYQREYFRNRARD